MNGKPNDVSTSIRQARKEMGITQQKLAELTGISLSNIKKYEQGTRTPKLNNIKKISKALNVPIDTLALDFVYNRSLYFNLNSSTEKKAFFEYLNSIGISVEGVFINKLDAKNGKVVKIITRTATTDYTTAKSNLIISESNLQHIENEIAEFSKRLINLLSEELDSTKLISLIPLKEKEQEHGE